LRIAISPFLVAFSPTVYYIKHRVENLYAPIDDKNPTVTPTVFFFNLITRKHVAAAFAKTTDWDLAFGGLYNSFLSGNNGQDINNYGTGVTPLAYTREAEVFRRQQITISLNYNRIQITR
jgi:hypothetical protein